MNENILSRELLKEVVIEQKNELLSAPDGITRNKMSELESLMDSPQIIIIKGVRRCGKSTLLGQFLRKRPDTSFHYLNFEDERLIFFDVTRFNLLLEIFYELNGKHRLFVFDEIQVVEGWERFIRRLHDAGNKIIITGSNADLLSQELGTKLTGRHVDVELFPFSYSEFLQFQNYQYKQEDIYLTEKRGLLHKYFNDYLTEGGFPIYLQSRQRSVLSSLYEDIISRDIIQRYRIDNLKLFRELTLFLLSNSTSSMTYNKLAEYFNLGSVNTIIKYVGYLENCYLLFFINPFSASYRKQINAPKKIYSICNAFIDKIGFHLMDNGGALLENLVFIELKRRFKNIFYYKTKNNLEVDFLVYNQATDFQLIQVSGSLNLSTTRKREINAILEAMKETEADEGWILTQSETEEITVEDKKIHVMPIYQWLLSTIKD